MNTLTIKNAYVPASASLKRNKQEDSTSSSFDNYTLPATAAAKTTPAPAGAYDYTAPYISFSHSYWQKYSSNNSRLYLKWSSNEYAKFTLKVDGKTVYTSWGYSKNIYVKNLKDGYHYYNLTATDTSGNRRTRTGSFTSDTYVNKPTYLRWSRSGSKVTFRWNSVYDRSGVKYEFAMKRSGYSYYSSYGSSSYSYKIINLSGSGRRYWKVRAIDGKGNKSAWVSGSSFYYAADTYVGKPSNLRWSRSGKSITFRWNSVYDSSGVKYEFAMKKYGSSYYTSYGTSTSNYKKINLNGSGTRYWMVRAIDGAGNKSSWISGRSFYYSSYSSYYASGSSKTTKKTSSAVAKTSSATTSSVSLDKELAVSSGAAAQVASTASAASTSAASSLLDTQSSLLDKNSMALAS